MHAESWHNEYMRIPFKDRGRDWDGSDCWGIARIILKIRHPKHPDLPMLDHYGNTLDKVNLPKIIEGEAVRAWVEVPIGQEQELDIGIFRTCGVPMHLGVVVRPGFMIHCQKGNGTLFTNYRTDHKWSNRIVGFVRYVG